MPHDDAIQHPAMLLYDLTGRETVVTKKRR
jgi:hypothetical protein